MCRGRWNSRNYRRDVNRRELRFRFLKNLRSEASREKKDNRTSTFSMINTLRLTSMRIESASSMTRDQSQDNGIDWPGCYTGRLKKHLSSKVTNGQVSIVCVISTNSLRIFRRRKNNWTSIRTSSPFGISGKCGCFFNGIYSDSPRL